jgi:pimeloyl-ACP methyl ester carboxylesterase
MAAQATASAGPIAYDDRGHGEPALLLMTGWCSNRERWEEASALAAHHRRVIRFDWRGHGQSAPAEADFGVAEMLSDALAVIDAAGLGSFVPCSASHSGWVAIELRRLLPERVRELILLDWMVTEPPEPYMQVIRQLKSEDEWPAARDILARIWRANVDSPQIQATLAEMRRHEADMWMRSGRVIERSYIEHGSPLRALGALDPPPPTLHLYGQPVNDEYLEAQQRFAEQNPWFSVRRLEGVRSHFAMIEAPGEVAAAIETFVAAG